jgi:hypothetical protein
MIAVTTKEVYPRGNAVEVVEPEFRRRRTPQMISLLFPLLQELPPLPTTVSTTVDLKSFALNALFAIIWAIVAAICFAIIVPIALKLYNLLTPGIDEMEQLKNGNVAVAIVLFGFILSITLVVIAVFLK